MKAFVDQFEEKLALAHLKCVEDHQATQNAQTEKGKKYTANLNVDSILEMEAATRAMEAMNLAQATPQKPVKKEKSKKAKALAPPRRKKKMESDDDEVSQIENSDDDQLQENDPDVSAPPPASTRPRRNKLLQNLNASETPRAGSRVSSRKGTPAKTTRTTTTRYVSFDILVDFANSPHAVHCSAAA